MWGIKLLINLYGDMLKQILKTTLRFLKTVIGQ